MFIIYIYIPLIAIFSIVWCWILTEDSMLTERVYLWLQKKLENKHNWLYNPLIGCPKCNAGQIALWFFLWHNWYDYSFINHIFFITTTIFLTSLLMKFYLKIYERI
jgi:hypothetical protein